jgi:hypothetical protein
MGTRIARLMPGSGWSRQGGLPLEDVGTIVGEGPPGSNVFWVSVAIDGGLTTGSGVPAWWAGDAQAR